MAEELESFEFTTGKGVYSWDTWLNGKPWKLEAGADFHVKIESFKGAALAAAKARGGKLRTAKIDDKWLVIQFVPD